MKSRSAMRNRKCRKQEIPERGNAGNGKCRKQEITERGNAGNGNDKENGKGKEEK